MARNLPQQVVIPGLDGTYFTAIDGTVWRKTQYGAKQLKGTSNEKGSFFKFKTPSGGTVTHSHSWCMRVTYFPNMPEDWRLMHINGIKRDYSVWNLKPMSMKELGQRCNRSYKQRSVIKIDPETNEEVAAYRSAREAGRENFIHFSVIADACNQKGKKRPGIAPDGFRYEWSK